jgi:hypothetical protein
MVVLEKRENQQISFLVRGLKDGGPEDLSNLIHERVNYDEIASVDLAGAPQGFHISVLTDRIQVTFFVHEDWRAQDAVDSLEAKLISSIDTEDAASLHASSVAPCAPCMVLRVARPSSSAAEIACAFTFSSAAAT